MTVLTWGSPGSRTYELGIDRGVLYLSGIAGVAWLGLVSVTENGSGGEARPYYVDGFKYLNIHAAEEYAATIEAFSAPKEFDACEGKRSVASGLTITQQTRKSFGFSYRTMIGNDLKGSDAGYKIHIIYNALTSPSEFKYKTLDSSGNISTLSWDVSTQAPMISGFRPTAHFVIDSRDVSADRLHYLEQVLYGSFYTDAKLPSVQELIGILSGVIGYSLKPTEDQEFFATHPNVNAGETSINGSNTPGIYFIPEYTNLNPDSDGIWELES